MTVGKHTCIVTGEDVLHDIRTECGKHAALIDVMLILLVECPETVVEVECLLTEAEFTQQSKG